MELLEVTCIRVYVGYLSPLIEHKIQKIKKMRRTGQSDYLVAKLKMQKKKERENVRNFYPMKVSIDSTIYKDTIKTAFRNQSNKTTSMIKCVRVCINCNNKTIANWESYRFQMSALLTKYYCYTTFMLQLQGNEVVMTKGHFPSFASVNEELCQEGKII